MEPTEQETQKPRRPFDLNEFENICRTGSIYDFQDWYDNVDDEYLNFGSIFTGGLYIACKYNNQQIIDLFLMLGYQCRRCRKYDTVEGCLVEAVQYSGIYRSISECIQIITEKYQI